MINKRQFIDNTIIAKLRENNIFEDWMTLDDIRNKLLNVVQKIEVEDLSKKRVLGYWAPFEHKLVIDKKLFEKKDMRTLESAIHELLHALTTKQYDSYNWKCGIQIVDLLKMEEFGRGLNEGITEYLAQKICPTKSKKYSEYEGISFNIAGSYPFEQIMIKQLAILYGEDKIINAYLNNQDLDIPVEQYKELRKQIDHINEEDSHLRTLKEKKKNTLTRKEKEEIRKSKSNIAITFAMAQQYFLENCLAEEIKNVSTSKEASELLRKLRALNSLDIKIDGAIQQIHLGGDAIIDEFDGIKGNYQKYNNMLIRKILHINNKSLSCENIKSVEDYLMGRPTQLIKKDNYFINKLKLLSKKTKKSISAYASKKINKFVPINRGEEGTIYIRKMEEQKIDNKNLTIYQYFTETEYLQYKNGDKNIKGNTLRGYIDLKKLKNDKEYRRAVKKNLLAQDIIEDKILNCNGYIGHLGANFKKREDSRFLQMFEEDEKFVKFMPVGYEEPMYIAEIEQKNNHNEKNQYIILKKEDIDKRRKGEKEIPRILIRGKIELSKINIDKEYTDFLQNKFAYKEQIKDSTRYYKTGVEENIKNISSLNGKRKNNNRKTDRVVYR